MTHNDVINTWQLIYLPEASSVATRHPEPLDVRGLTGADVLLLSRVAPPDLSNAPDLAIDRAVQVKELEIGRAHV